jgi:MFS family permease
VTAGSRGIDPLGASSIGFLLWLLMGYLLATSVLVVTFGRLGDQYGRAKLFNLGFVIFTISSVACALVPNTGPAGAWELILLRVVQGVGAAMITANSTAIITDAFPSTRRGFALGVNQVASLAGSFLGLVVGGVLAPWHWRLVFWVSVPIGVWGTYMGYRHLRDKPRDRSQAIRIDWWGNTSFALGLISILTAITYGLQPYGTESTGWGSPKVLGGLAAGVLLLVAFVLIEGRVKNPMIDLSLFRNRAFTAGNTAGLLTAMSRGGLQFMLIIWLQGIWLPLHGYSFARTPLWAGIYLLPLTVGFLAAGPLSGALSDRKGARTLSTCGLMVSMLSYVGLIVLPVDFSYVTFAILLALNGIGSGLFAAPNAAAVMNSVSAADRGAASGVRATAQNGGTVLSIGLFFTLMAVGLASPVGLLFAAFLGANPIKTLIHGVDPTATVPAAVTNTKFFPHLLSGPFNNGLTVVFLASIGMLVVATIASLLRGGKFVHSDQGGLAALADEGEEIAPVLEPDIAPVSTRTGLITAVPAGPSRSAPQRPASSPNR